MYPYSAADTASLVNVILKYFIKMTKNIKFVFNGCFSSLKCTKTRFRLEWGSALDPGGGVYDAP